MTYQVEVQNQLKRLGTKPQNVLVFYGCSGIGKTYWSKQLYNNLQKEYLCSYLDGSGLYKYSGGFIDKALLQLRSKLGKVDFSCFDFAYLYYWQCENPHLAVDSVEFAKRMDNADRLANASDVAAAISAMDFKKLASKAGLTEISGTITELAPQMFFDLMELAKDSVPYIQFLSKLNWFIAKESETIRNWWKQTGSNNLRELKDCVSHYEVLERLPLFFARDLNSCLFKSQRKAVIIVDGYDDLLDSNGRCGWLEDLISEPNPNVLWVLFSSQQVSFTENIHNIPILPLTESESQCLLTASGIPEQQCQQIIQASNGIPFYLQLGIETWRNISKKRLPQNTDFTNSLADAFRKHDSTWDSSERVLWQLLANCRTWNQELFIKLMQQFNLDNSSERFDKVIASPYVEEVGEGKWRLHFLMRQHLQLNQPENFRCNVNSWLFEYYQAVYEVKLEPTTLDEALFYAGECQIDTAINWCLEQITYLQEKGQHQTVVSLLKTSPLTPLLRGEENNSTIDYAARAWSLMGKSQTVMGRYNEAELALLTAKQQWQALQLGESLEAASVEFDLSKVYLQLDRVFDADKAAQTALKIRRSLLGKNSPLVAEVLNRQAEIASSQENYHEAVQLIKQAEQIFTSQSDTQPLQLAQLKYTATYLNWYNNNLDAAAKSCLEGLEIVEQFAGQEHPEAITGYALLGSIYQAMGQHQYNKVFELYQKALNAAETTLGLSHPQTLQLLKALANLSRKVGLHDQASEFEQQHNVNVQVGELEETALVADALRRRGVALREKGEYGKAEPLLKQAVRINLKVFGNQHLDTANSLNSLAVLYESQGRYIEAEPVYQQALSIYQKVLGAEHPDTANSFNNLASLYSKQGRYAEAEPLFQQALSIRQKVLGAEHPHNATTLNNLALLYESQGRYTEAEPLLQQALSICQKVLGAEHPDTANSLNNLAGLYESQGRYTEAEPLYQQALSIYQKVLGAEHPHTVASLNNLVELYKSQGKYTEAELLYQKVTSGSFIQ